jgi:hypothetical protein
LLVTKKSIKAWFPENEHYDSIIVNQPSKFWNYNYWLSNI